MEKIFNLFDDTTGVSTDTRKIKKGNLFIALKGGNFNGNEYATKAIELGAKYAIVDEKIYADNQQIFYVENGLNFLQSLGNYHRNKFNIPIIGITGTNGKTTTKELIATVLSKKYNVLYTQGNLNNHIGVPLTLLNLTKEHEIAIIEMGASHIGDIKELTDIANPSHGIITNIGEAHIEGFGSYENVIHTKTELYKAISENKGTLFYNSKDAILKKHLPTNTINISYSIEGKGMISGHLETQNPFLAFHWENIDYTSTVVKSQLVGIYNLNNILAAICIGRHFGVDAWLINRAIEDYRPSNNRSQLEKTANNTLLIDCYNANPTSTKLALESFAKLSGDNKLFILGDMLELGEESLTYHNKIIAETKTLGLQGLFVGTEYKIAGNGDESILKFENTEEVRQFLLAAIPKNNFILLKGSRGIGLEKLIDIL